VICTGTGEPGKGGGTGKNTIGEEKKGMKENIERGGIEKDGKTAHRAGSPSLPLSSGVFFET